MPSHSTINRVFDVVIIGGGPAGLSVALGLARQLYTACVLDSGVYRNERSSHMHNMIAFDHVSPAKFREQAKANILERYDTIEFQRATITNLQQGDDGLFSASDEAGNVWSGKKIVLATGVRDVAPGIDGYDDCWARGMYVFAPLFPLSQLQKKLITNDRFWLANTAYSATALRRRGQRQLACSLWETVLPTDRLCTLHVWQTASPSRLPSTQMVTANSPTSSNLSWPSMDSRLTSGPSADSPAAKGRPKWY